MHYLREVVLNQNYNASGSEIGGRFVDLNCFENAVHGRSLDTEISLGILFDLDSDLFNFADIEFPLDDVVNEHGGYFWSTVSPKQCLVDLKVAWSQLSNRPYVSRYA